VNEVAAALPSPRIINPDMRARQVASLARLNEIKDSLNQNPRFDVLGSLIQFNCDQHLTPFAINTPVTRLGELLIYAGAETARPYNAADPRDSMYGHAQRVNVVQTEHMTRIDRFNQILQSHANGNYPGVAGDAAKRSLSQIFNILNAKKVRADQGHYNRDELKNEIRWVATCINDAHRNCIDQINAQLESIKLSVLVTELGNVAGLNTINIFGAHALFQYRANLLTEICQSQNRDEIHMVDMERIAKNELAEILNLGSRENVGAQYGWLIQNRVERIGAARDEFLRLYNEAPRAQEHDRRPLAYLVNGIKTSIPQAPLEKLRTKLLSWVQAHLRLELDATGLEYINEDVKAIVEAASEDPENDFLMGGDLSKAGILWLLESANIIR